MKTACGLVLNEFAGPPNMWKLGMNKVFMKMDALKRLDDANRGIIIRVAVNVQRLFRLKRARKMFASVREVREGIDRILHFSKNETEVQEKIRETVELSEKVFKKYKLKEKDIPWAKMLPKIKKKLKQLEQSEGHKERIHVEPPPPVVSSAAPQLESKQDDVMKMMMQMMSQGSMGAPGGYATLPPIHIDVDTASIENMSEVVKEARLRLMQLQSYEYQLQNALLGIRHAKSDIHKLVELIDRMEQHQGHYEVPHAERSAASIDQAPPIENSEPGIVQKRIAKRVEEEPTMQSLSGWLNSMNPWLVMFRQ